MRKVFFDHVPKTGGTAVTRAIARAARLDSSGAPDLRVLGTLRYSDLVLRYASVPFVGAHCGYEPLQKLDKERLHCILLRDPLERLLSAYAFNRTDVPDDIAPSASVRAARTLAVEEYLLGTGESGTGQATNWYVDHLVPLGWDGTPITAPEQRLEFAIHALESFDLIGFQDSMEEFCDQLCGLAGIGQVPTVEVVNQSSRPLRASDLSPGAASIVREKLRWDYELLEHARLLARRQRLAFASSWSRASCPGTSPDRLAAASLEAHAGQPQETLPSPGSAECMSTGARICSVSIAGDLSLTSVVPTEDFVNIAIDIASTTSLQDVTIGISLRESSGRVAFGTNSLLLGYRSALSPGASTVCFRFQNRLGAGDYLVDACIHRGLSIAEGCYHFVRGAASFQVRGTLGQVFEGFAVLYPTMTAAGSASITEQETPDRKGSEGTVTMISRFGTPLDRFEAELRCDARAGRVRTCDHFCLPVTLRNTSGQTWASSGLRRVTLSYRWLAEDGQAAVVLDGMRTELHEDMAPGSSRPLSMSIAAPESPGRHLLVISPVQEGVAWFCDRGMEPIRLTFEVVD